MLTVFRYSTEDLHDSCLPTASPGPVPTGWNKWNRFLCFYVASIRGELFGALNWFLRAVKIVQGVTLLLKINIQLFKLQIKKLNFFSPEFWSLFLANGKQPVWPFEWAQTWSLVGDAVAGGSGVVVSVEAAPLGQAFKIWSLVLLPGYLLFIFLPEDVSAPPPPLPASPVACCRAPWPQSLSALWSRKPKLALSSINCLSHGVLSQPQKVNSYSLSYLLKLCQGPSNSMLPCF